MQRIDRALKDQISQQLVLVERLVNGKVTKQSYLETENQINKKKEEAVSRMHLIVKSL